MGRTRIKICGITSVQDGLAAVACGVDAVGINLAEGPRRISLEKAAAISQALPPFVTRVGLFVNADADAVKHAAERVPLDAVQLHGEESPSLCRALAPLKIVKALQDGRCHTLVTPDPYEMGQKAVETLVNHLRGKQVQATVNVGIQLMTKKGLVKKPAPCR